MSEQLPVDQAARERFRCEWRKNFAVSANAGSGKTTAISERLAAMAVEPEGAEALRRTAVVTYTVKAADEIAERARERLLQKLAADGGAAGAGLAALEHLERVFFGTLHSFCLKLAREHGLESGLDPAPEVLATDDDVEAVWEDFLAEDPMEFTALDAGRLSALFRHVELETVFEQAKKLDARQAKALMKRAPVGLPAAPAWGEWDVLQTLPAKGAGKANILSSQEKAREWRVRYEAAASDVFIGIYEPDGKSAALVDVARRWMAPLLGWVAPAAGAVAGELALRFRDYRRARGVQTYEDQVAAARALLEREETLEQVRKEGWRVILDEAQDTDEAQFFVLVEISRPAGAQAGTWPGDGEPPRAGHFCMVGDGQQAIYSSRASVRTFQRFLEAFDGGEAGDRLNFEVTFRAPRAVVELLNTTLPEAFSAKQDYNRGLAAAAGAEEPCLQVPYQALCAGPKNQEGAVRRIELHGMPPKKPGKGDAEYFQEEMRQVAAWLRAGGPGAAGVKEWGELCVLLPRNGWMDAAVNALQAEGLKVSRQSKRMPAGAQPAYAWMAGLMAVCCFPEDDYEWLGVLRTVFGISDRVLAEEIRRVGRFNWEEPERHMELVENALKAVRPSLMSIDDENVLLDTWVGRLIQNCDLMARAKALDASGGVERELGRLLAEARSQAGDGISPREWWMKLLRGRRSDAKPGRAEPDAINLMTCHSAKGLEWPAVLVPGMWRKISFETPTELQVLPGAGGEPNVYLKAGYIPSDTREARERERKRELVRLLYVTLTRARRTLLVAWGEEMLAAPDQSMASLWRHDLCKLPLGELADVAGANLAVKAQGDESRAVEATDTQRQGEIGILGREGDLRSERRAGETGTCFFRRVLPHQLAHAVDVPRSAIREEADGMDVSVAVSAGDPIAYGLWWHETMEFFPWDADGRGIQSYGELRLSEAALIGAEKRAELEWRQLARSNAWRQIVDQRWLRRAELSVLAPMEAGLEWMDGVMDLVLHDEGEREVWVVDWKTNRRMNQESEAGMLRRLESEYAPQLKAYATSLRQIFPECRVRAFVFSTALAQMTEIGGQPE